MSRHSLFAGILVFWSLSGFTQETTAPVTLQARDSIQLKSPVFTDFSCLARNTSSVTMEWKADNVKEGDYYIVERSRDGNLYETLSAQVVTDTAMTYRLNDNSPFSGTLFYRVKWLGKTGEYSYSRPVRVALSSDLDFKFYPNPADKLLIIRPGHDIEVAILDPGGSVRISKELAPGLQIINISSLEKGSYILKIADRDSNRVVSEQLLKN